MEENDPVIIVDANDLVPQVNPAELPSAPPEGITEPEAINQSAIDAAGNYLLRSTLRAIGDDPCDEKTRQGIPGTLCDTVRRLHLEANPEWAGLETYHEKAVDAALRLRLGLVELLLGSSPPARTPAEAARPRLVPQLAQKACRADSRASVLYGPLERREGLGMAVLDGVGMLRQTLKRGGERPF